MTLSFTPGGSVSEYLHRYERNELLRFLTCGSVDDGKSTLIGRLLHDTGRLYDDHLKAIEAESKVHGTQGGALDLALVVDGLKAEREQGITIDVAYRYFATAHRSFIIADCPGHEQYTRNMATGASHCQLAITLIDARSGVTTQTRRHAFIASLLGICHVVAAVNKMDLVGWGEGRFREIESEFLDYCVKVGIAGPIAVPVSALTGENVVTRGTNAAWYSTNLGVAREGACRACFASRSISHAGAVCDSSIAGLSWVRWHDCFWNRESGGSGADHAFGSRDACAAHRALN